MSDALERLAQLVRQAESKTRVQRLETEVRQAASRLQAAEDRMKKADHLLAENRPVCLRNVEKAESDELLLRELIKKLALAHSSLDSEQHRQAECEIEAAKREIVVLRTESEGKLDAMLKEADAARRELRTAREQYHSLRKELDQLLPHLAENFAAEDRMAKEADLFLPLAQIQALAREVEDGERHFALLDQREQFAQLKIWIGKFRRLQDIVERDKTNVSEEEEKQLREIFPSLVGISKQYMPGYIEAFSRAFETDWDEYVAEAAEQLQLATDAVRRDREGEQRRKDVAVRDQERQKAAREAGHNTLGELKGILAMYRVPEEGVDLFLEVLGRAVASFGQSDPQLLEIVRPYSELLTGPEFRALRRNLDRNDSDDTRQRETSILRDQYQDILAETRGKKAVMIGGDLREDRRRSIQQILEFESLEWVPYESARPVLLRSLEQRVRTRGMDLLLILKEFVGHNVTESMRPLCEEFGVPCLLVERGYGIAQVADAVRRSLPRLASAHEQSNGSKAAANEKLD